ncbi:ABC transporter substrate-binding protein [Parasynechococcus sp.]|uniref:ABC transporter substrate-binding protein n=1 Tax=Parasynechococcus sp. TaxID=3101203 RepID=UPI003703C68A
MRRRLRWWWSLLSLPLLTVATLAWSAAHAVEQVTLLMPAPFAESTAPLVRQFNEQHRGRIELNVSSGPRDTEAMSDLAISSLILGAPPYDALLIDVTWLPKYAAAGWLEPLDGFFSAEDEQTLIRGARQGNRYQDHLFRWPFNADVGLLYWRTDLMEAPPQTPNELLGISRQLIADNAVKTGFVWQGRQYEGLSCDALEIFRGFGGRWLGSDGQPALTSANVQRAVDWMETLIRTGASPRAVTNYAETESLQAFKAGDAALMRNWPYAWAELQKPDSAVRGRIGITTMVAEPGQTPVATLGSWGLSMLKGARHPDATVEAIRYLTEAEAQKQRFIAQGYTPTVEALYRDPELLAVAPQLPQLAQALELATPRPPTPLYAQISDVLQRQLSGVLTGNQSSEEALKRAQTSTSTILQSAGGA